MFLRIAFAATLLATPIYANGYSVGDTFEDPMQIAQEAVAVFGHEAEGRPGIEVDISVDFLNRITILVAHTGQADDSVAGERNLYLLEEGVGGVWTLVFRHTDFMCYRGENSVTWTAMLCP